MHINCPKCGYSRDVGNIRMPHGTVLAKCSACSAEFNICDPVPPLSTAQQLSVCPSCCTSLSKEPLADSCSNCGLIISKYLQRQAQAARPAPESFSDTQRQPYRTQASSLLLHYYKQLGIALAALLCLVVMLVYDRKLDKGYVLLPGVWQGEMSYLGKKHPFILELESVQNGILSGRMEWVGYLPSYVLAIKGTYIGNHLVFEDLEFINNSGDYGLHDKKDVYIVDEEMNGTDKNGKALLHALRKASSPGIGQ